jgi:hypothetical protein
MEKELTPEDLESIRKKMENMPLDPKDRGSWKLTEVPDELKIYVHKIMQDLQNPPAYCQFHHSIETKTTKESHGEHPCSLISAALIRGNIFIF